MFRPLFISGWLVATGWVMAAPTSPRPVDQLCVAGNACGPAALLNALRFGSKDWQRAAAAVAGESDRQQVMSVIRDIGMRPSKSLHGKPRWSRAGVGVADLCDMANEMTVGLYLPPLTDEVLFLNPKETPEKLLVRCHQKFAKSIAKGFPPLLSLRRFVWRRDHGQLPQWVAVDAHFVTVRSVPKQIDRHATSFAMDFIDPWGGCFSHGTIRIPPSPVIANAAGQSTCLEAVGQMAAWQRTAAGRGERSVVVVSAVIGRW